MGIILDGGVTALLAKVDTYKARFPADIHVLQGISQDYAQKQARWQQEEQTLNIGIMGQVKAGKSTFLNALLFDGRPILPEAATPKTANLTRVVHGQTYSLLVDYYRQVEWQQIETVASQAPESEEGKVACELLAMVQSAGLDLAAHWQRMQACDYQEALPAESLADLQGLLNQYTGNDGCYTPLVKATQLTLPDEDLKGFEVVDTPGMNDPVQSRSQKTRQFMAECDVVFFLSRCSQFMDSSDLQLLSEQLPGKGVKRLVLVAGQFDSTLLDDGYDQDDLASCEQNIRTRLARLLEEKVGPLVEWKRQQGNEPLAQMLAQLANPVFASTYAYGFAHWPQSRWGEGMQHAHGQLTKMADECWHGYRLAQEDWLRIANFDALRQAYQQARADRLPLLEQQRTQFTRESEAELTKALAAFASRVEGRMSALQKNDLQSLTQQQQACRQQIAGISQELAASVSEVITRIRRSSQQITKKLEQDKQNFDKLAVRQGSEEEVEFREVSTSRWYNPFSWGSTETVMYTSITEYKYLNANDAIEQILQYAADATKQIRQHLNAQVDPAALKISLKQKLLQHLDTHSAKFDAALFRAIFDGVIDRLRIPDADLQLGDTTDWVTLSGEVRDAQQMAKLRTELAEALAMVYGRIEQCVTEASKSLLASLTDLQEGLQEQLLGELESELAQIKQGLANKEQELVEYDQLVTLLKTA